MTANIALAIVGQTVLRHNICNSIRHFCKCWADVFYMLHLRLAGKCSMAKIVHGLAMAIFVIIKRKIDYSTINFFITATPLNLDLSR
jgi:hypothetical protein